MSEPYHISARERLQRLMYTVCGVGALVFGLLLMEGPSGFLAQQSVLHPVHWWFAIVIAVLVPASFTALASVLPIRLLSGLAAVAMVGFVVAQLTWVPAMEGAILTGGATPWLQGINAVPCVLAAMLLRQPWVWAYPFSQGPIVAIVQLAAGDGTLRDALLDGVGAWVYCTILVAMAVAVISAADRQDRARSRALTDAAVDAAMRAREHELSRINAIVHDEIMSVLVAASRPHAPPQLAGLATAALTSIEEISHQDQQRSDYSAPDLVTMLRTAATNLDTCVVVNVRAEATDIEIPAAVAESLAEALSEAVRNSLRHAGPVTVIGVRVSTSDAGVSVSIRDDGRGFDPTTVPPDRLGIRVSIHQRLDRVQGWSRVVSAVGTGTTVQLGWSPS